MEQPNPKSSARDQSTECFFEDLSRIKESGKDLKGNNRDFFNSITQRMEINCHSLEALRQEHLKLREALNGLIEQKRDLKKIPDLAGDLKKLNHDRTILKKQIDILQHKKEESIKKQAELQAVIDNFHNIKKESEEDLTSITSKLANVNIKTKEADRVMRVYEQIDTLLGQEKVRWNKLIDDQDRVIERRKKDVSDLSLIARDSKRSRDSARREYIETESKYNRQKVKRDTNLERKKEQLPVAMGRMGSNFESKPDRVSQQSSFFSGKANRVMKEKKEERLREVEKSFESLREKFGTTEPQEIQSLFEDRKKKGAALKAQIQSLREETDSLRKEKENLKKTVGEKDITSANAIGLRRVMKEGSAIVATKMEDAAKLKREAESVYDSNKAFFDGANCLPNLMKLVCKEDAPKDSADIFEWAAKMVEEAKKALSEEDYDVMQMINRREVAASSESPQSQTKAGNKKKTEKKISKEGKGDISSRVYDRKTVKGISSQVATKNIKPQK